MKRTRGPDFALLWTQRHPAASELRLYPRAVAVNRWPGSMVLARKDRLASLLSCAAQKHALQYQFVPVTFSLPKEEALVAAWLPDRKLRARSFTRVERPRLAPAQPLDPPLIFKPAGGSCGRGIKLVSSTDQLLGLRGRGVLQEYIARPFLVGGFKFDLRVYCAVTSWSPLVAYVHREGIVRFCTIPYDAAGPSQKRMHLTNYSVNKHAKSFERGEGGSKRSLAALLETLAGLGHDAQQVLCAVDEAIVKTLIAVQPAFLAPLPPTCKMFELYGFDILLDHKLDPFLLEINTSPSLACDSRVDYEAKAQVVADLITMVGVRPSPAHGRAHGLAGSPLRRVPAHAQPQPPPKWKKRIATEARRCCGWRRVFPAREHAWLVDLFDAERDLNREAADFAFGLDLARARAE